MQILVAFFLAALVGCYGEECIQKGRSCMEPFLMVDRDSSMGDTYQVIYCNELNKAIECMTKASESCAGNEFEVALKMTVDALKDTKKEECRVIDVLSDDNEIQKCFEENVDYISECLQVSLNEVTEKLADRLDEKDIQDRRMCGLYIETVFCAVGRIDEKCGEEAVKELVRKIGDTPETVNIACRAVGVEIVSGLDEDKRKK